MEKLRLKLYKSKKLWVTASTVLFSITLPQAGQTLAADTEASHTDKQDTMLVDAKNQKVTTEQSAASTTADDKQQAKAPVQAATPTAGTAANDTHATHDRAQEATPAHKEGLDTSKPGVTRYVNADGSEVKGDYRTQDGARYYFDATTGAAVTGIQVIHGQRHAFDDQGREQTNQFVTASNGDQYYFDAQGNTVTGLQTINQSQYYFDATGRMVKNMTVVVDQQVDSFDAKTGQRDAAQPAPQTSKQQTIPVNDFVTHNQMFDTTDKSVNTVDGYLTAESWYRPKDILDNGTNWRASRSDERRPLLMAWQPDLQTTANYLNTMRAIGLSSSTADFTAQSSVKDMVQAQNDVQRHIEQRISAEQSTAWLKATLDNFVNEQPQWNITSESPSNDHLQQGAMAYLNSPDTPDANSNFRLLNRTPTNQSGKERYHTDNSKGGFELLLANDVDNSNPVVQAEQLNWLYYLTNFGSITANDKDANFDGIRVDAVDNVDADLLQIASDYFKEAYNVGANDEQTNQRLSLLEDWSSNDPEYLKASGSKYLTMDAYLQTQLKYSLTQPANARDKMSRFKDFALIDRVNDTTENEATPNYSFVRAHDSEVQTVISQIVSDLYPGTTSGLTPTPEQLTAAFKVYNADMAKTDKHYTQYNMPSAYAMLLTNKDTIPRIYYGDVYTDDGQYMATKTPYFDTIDNLLKSRVKFVAGGQSMTTDNNDILTSVRYGKGIMTADQSAPDDLAKNSGIGVVVSNKPNLALSATDTVTLHMGQAHANQLYQAIVTPTAEGFANYALGDANAPTHMTNANGDLILTAADVKGYSNPQISGYLSVWVPADATDDQDARTAASDQKLNDGNVLHSNAALDSHVIYESFSNFQAMPTTADEAANVKIAQNANLFKQWGVTSVQFAPQYRSSTDSSFLDSIIKNGYAFTDRYDLGFGTPTKYGTDVQLRDAIKAMHASGIQAMADWVPDQIYNLEKNELVTVARTNATGEINEDSGMNHTLYLSKTRGGGEYQAKFGGAFLDQLKKDYPVLFKELMVSTGLPIDGSTKIQEWSAKYFNGSNIQGRGAGYILADNGQHAFRVVSNSTDKAFLPTQLLGQTTLRGFVTDKDGCHYYSNNGYMVKKSFIHDDVTGNYYYFNSRGNMVTGRQLIDKKSYYFLPNGVELRGAFLQDASGSTNYYKFNGQQAAKEYVTDADGNTYYFDEDGAMVTGSYTVDGHDQYFNENGVQAKDAIIVDDNFAYYFAAGSGNMVRGQFVTINGDTYYASAAGNLMTGVVTIDNKSYNFGDDGVQIKGQIAIVDGQEKAFNAIDGAMIVSDYFTPDNGVTWYYADEHGTIVTGNQTIRNEKRYFEADGKQVKNCLATIDNTTYAFDDHGRLNPIG